MTDKNDLIVARAAVPRFTRRVAVVCHTLHCTRTVSGTQQMTKIQTVAGEEGTNSNEKPSCIDSGHCDDVQVDLSPSSDVSSSRDQVTDPDAEPAHAELLLQCDNQCLDVFASLEDSLRADSKELHISDDFDITARSSNAVIVITNLDSVTGLEDCMRKTAQHLNKNVCALVFIFTNRLNECELSLSSIALLQRQIRDIFRDHSSNVTVILRSISAAVSSDSSSDSSEPGTKQRARSQDTPDGSDAAVTQTSVHGGYREDECGSKIAHVVSTLLNQSADGFHGQVMVL